MLRQQLFATEPNWWLKEASRRRQVFSTLVTELTRLKNTSSKKKQYTNAEIYAVFKKRLNIRTHVDEHATQAFETKLRTFIKNTLPESYEAAEMLVRQSNSKRLDTFDLEDKNFGLTYQY